MIVLINSLILTVILFSCCSLAPLQSYIVDRGVRGVRGERREAGDLQKCSLSGQVTPSILCPPGHKACSSGGKGQFIDSIKAPLSSQDEIRNLFISPTQNQAAKTCSPLHCKCNEKSKWPLLDPFILISKIYLYFILKDKLNAEKPWKTMEETLIFYGGSPWDLHSGNTSFSCTYNRLSDSSR